MTAMDSRYPESLPPTMHALFNPDPFDDYTVDEMVQRARGIFRLATRHVPNADDTALLAIQSAVGPLVVLATVWGPDPSAVGFWAWMRAAWAYQHPNGLHPSVSAVDPAGVDSRDPIDDPPADLWDMEAWVPRVHPYPLAERIRRAGWIGRQWCDALGISFSVRDLTVPLLVIVALESPWAGQAATTRRFIRDLADVLAYPMGAVAR